MVSRIAIVRGGLSRRPIVGAVDAGFCAPAQGRPAARIPIAVTNAPAVTTLGGQMMEFIRFEALSRCLGCFSKSAAETERTLRRPADLGYTRPIPVSCQTSRFAPVGVGNARNPSPYGQLGGLP